MLVNSNFVVRDFRVVLGCCGKRCTREEGTRKNNVYLSSYFHTKVFEKLLIDGNMDIIC